MGLWNAHTSVGNIGGSLVAAAALGYGWGWAFLAPGAALIAAAGLIWLLLAAEPEEAGLERDGTSELQVLTILTFYNEWLLDCSAETTVRFDVLSSAVSPDWHSAGS